LEELVTSDEKRRIVGCGFGAAIVVAPFLALLYGTKAGLAVLASALTLTLYAVVQAMDDDDDLVRRRLTILAAINLAFLVVVVGTLTFLVFR
jgi:hypothetical protein